MHAQTISKTGTYSRILNKLLSLVCDCCCINDIAFVPIFPLLIMHITKIIIKNIANINKKGLKHTAITNPYIINAGNCNIFTSILIFDNSHTLLFSAITLLNLFLLNLGTKYKQKKQQIHAKMKTTADNARLSVMSFVSIK